MGVIKRAVVFVTLLLGIGAIASPFAAAQEDPSSPPPAEALVLEVVTDASGNVTVNSVLFEASLGVDAGQIVELVEAARTSVDALLGASDEVQERVNTVLMTVQ